MDSWHALRSFTRARIAQGSAGSALPTSALLDFQLAHAQARDAVLKEWHLPLFEKQVKDLWSEVEILESCADNRAIYLQRPDLGRRLKDSSIQRLETMRGIAPDIALILSNGLSTTAVDHHAQPLLLALKDILTHLGLNTGPLFLVANGRVALSDEIGKRIGARSSIILIGERPGLSAPDSLGAYLTLFPEFGKNDADRNCISNIREPDGLSYRMAAGKMVYLLRKGFEMGIGGVALKDDSPSEPLQLESVLKRKNILSAEIGE